MSAGTDNHLVLIVDDNDFNRDGLVLYLQNSGYATLEAADAATAYTLAEIHHPDSAVVDIVIPTVPGGPAQIAYSVGVELTRRLKAVDPALGVVLFSAYEDRGREIWALIREGVRGVAYLLKGSRPERLRQALDDVRAGHVILDGDAAAGKSQLVAELRAHLSPLERPWVERAVRLMPAGAAYRLFDLAADIGEKNDLSKERPDVAAKLRSRFDVSRRDMDACEPRGPFRDY